MQLYTFVHLIDFLLCFSVVVVLVIVLCKCLSKFFFRIIFLQKYTKFLNQLLALRMHIIATVNLILTNKSTAGIDI